MTEGACQLRLINSILRQSTNNGGRATNNIRKLCRHLEGKVVNTVVKSAGVWAESQHTLTRGNKTYAQFVTTLREARPHIQRALEQEQRQRTKKHVA